MAGSVRKIMAYLGLVDDEYDDYEELSERSRPAPSRSSRPDYRDRDRDWDRDRDRDWDRGRDDDRRERPQPAPNNISRIRPVTSSGAPAQGLGEAPRPSVSAMPTEAKVHIVAPSTFADAKEVGDHIKQNSPVIINMQRADRDLQRRMIDFCSGVAYVLGCSMERVADQVFLLTPNDVTVSAEERARLRSRDFDRN